MAILQPKSRPSDSIPTSSMADVAFLLLVFFLVTTVFPKDKGLALVLPDPDAGPVEVSPENILHLAVLESGTVRVRFGGPGGRIYEGIAIKVGEPGERPGFDPERFVYRIYSQPRTR